MRRAALRNGDAAARCCVRRGKFRHLDVSHLAQPGKDVTVEDVAIGG